MVDSSFQRLGTYIPFPTCVAESCSTALPPLQQAERSSPTNYLNSVGFSQATMQGITSVPEAT